MRWDTQGIFWQDAVKTGKRVVDRIQPAIPDTGWKRPKYFPNLQYAKRITIDTETYDPEFDDYGPGWARGRGHIVGVSIAADGDAAWYFPVHHEIEAHDNFPPAEVFAWLAKELCRPHQSKIGANLLYDVGWLRQHGVRVVGPLYDVQFAETLINENNFVALEKLSQSHLGEGKVGSLLFQWLSDYFGGPATAWQRRNIYRSPPRLAAPYAIGDVVLPPRILDKQMPILHRYGLGNLFRLECDLIPLLVEMRFAGVRVDQDAAARSRDTIAVKEKELAGLLRNMTGFDVDVWASASIAKAFDHFGLPYPQTEPSKSHPQGQPSFRKEFLEKQVHPLGKLVRNARRYNKTRTTFVESYLLNGAVNGVVHGSFHPLKGDEGGAKTGRFSASGPNWQNLTSKDEELTPLVRGPVVPDVGHKQWRKIDLSQIQYRYMAHYAVGPGSDELRRRYNEDPETDYHNDVQGQVKQITGMDLVRKIVKNCNFGFLFGMGLEHLCDAFGMTVAQGEPLVETYHKGAPYVKPTLRATADEAGKYGIITTILGRRLHFDLWEPVRWGDDRPALPYAMAKAAYGSIRRAGTFRGLNYRLQGSEGDHMKKAMVQCYQDGVFDYTGVPRITVHDELGFSDPGSVDDGFAYIKHVMETCIPIRVPVLAEMTTGPNWAACG